jgi:hypothetical protein
VLQVFTGGVMHGLKSIFSIILAFGTYMCQPDPASDSGSSCQTNNANNEPDGGLTCGESFDLSNGQGGPGVFAAKVSQYVHVNSAGIVETDTMSKLFLKIEYHVNEDPMFARNSRRGNTRTTQSRQNELAAIPLCQC